MAASDFLLQARSLSPLSLRGRGAGGEGDNGRLLRGLHPLPSRPPSRARGRGARDALDAARAGIAKAAEDRSTAFVVGKILMIAVPGAGMLLTAAEAQAEKALAVDSVVGSADLFANEVVASLGGDPLAGVRLSQRLEAAGSKVDAVMMGEFRRSNAQEHVRRLQALKMAQDQARVAAEAAERRAQEEAQRRPPPMQPQR